MCRQRSSGSSLAIPPWSVALILIVLLLLLGLLALILLKILLMILVSTHLSSHYTCMYRQNAQHLTSSIILHVCMYRLLSISHPSRACIQYIYIYSSSQGPYHYIVSRVSMIITSSSLRTTLKCVNLRENLNGSSIPRYNTPILDIAHCICHTVSASESPV